MGALLVEPTGYRIAVMSQAATARTDPNRNPPMTAANQPPPDGPIPTERHDRLSRPRRPAPPAPPPPPPRPPLAASPPSDTPASSPSASTGRRSSTASRPRC